MKYLIRLAAIILILHIILSLCNFYDNKWDISTISTGTLGSPKSAVEQKSTNKDSDIKKNVSENKNIHLETKQDIDNKESIDFTSDIKPDIESIDINYPGNYIERAVTIGQLIRWNPETFPLRVYIEKDPELPAYFYKEVKKAFDAWKKASGNYFRFIYTESEDYADIRCKFDKSYDRDTKNGIITAGHSSIKIVNNQLKYSEIVFGVYGTNNKYFKPGKVCAVAKHEIGHSLGIRGHSTNPGDIMYPLNHSENISRGDINTLRLLYSIVPDISNKEFSKEAKTKLVQADEILGDYDSRLARELNYTKQDIELSKESKFDVGAIADLYYAQKNYEAAIKSYKKLIPKVYNTKAKASIYYKIAFSYMKLDKHNEALNYALKAYNLNNDPDIAYFIARIYYYTGNYEKAKNLAQSILRRYPKTYNMYSILGNIYVHEKNYNELKFLAQKAKQYFPENPPITLTYK